MRLINTETLDIESFIGPEFPRYAILSHTWTDDEPTLADAQAGFLAGRSSAGCRKVRDFCTLARQDGLSYAWADTCCIDKTSSSELTESINSMFRWYTSADICYVYLADLESDASSDTMASCRWFTRGWTLQELIAPSKLQFYDKEWGLRGSKMDFADQLLQITNIPDAVLQDRTSLRIIPVGRRMSWAANRQTTRPEDMAYCLMGIFDEEIMKSSNDLSIFLWQSARGPRYRGILAEEPSEFVSASRLRVGVAGMDSPQFTITNKGVKIKASLADSGRGIFALSLNHVDEDSTTDEVLGVWLKRHRNGAYARAYPHVLVIVSESVFGTPSRRYLSKHMSPTMAEAVDSATDNAFVFEGDFHSQYYQHLSTTSSAWWDRDRMAYLRDNGLPFVAFHLFRAGWDNSRRDNRFVLAFGVAEDGTAWLSLAADSWTRPSKGAELLAAALKGDLKAVEALGLELWKEHKQKEMEHKELWGHEQLPQSLTFIRRGPTMLPTGLSEQPYTLEVYIGRGHLDGHDVYLVTLGKKMPRYRRMVEIAAPLVLFYLVFIRVLETTCTGFI
ncbi:HET domain-containing protein [Fusarium keratoplasticum]|uniref:HET domain-containing protein n=1 Tax=Fusarium keratoplasticum TaxID=1328300 RepID=A0ACC0QPK2_9HYPO|nr:HET domain-containing protein [Fusarium keratoplasticum]KAI8663262.1 HET domain-containing protein [Fusarium keratoplasticum]